MRNLAIGFVLGVAATIAGVIAVAVLVTGPALIVKASAPASAMLEVPVLITIEATNPHDDPVILDNVHVPDKFFQNLDIVAIRPSPSPDSPLEFFGSKTWYFEISVPPQEMRTIELDVVAYQPGTHVAEFSVCNYYEVCSQIVVPIEFTE